MIDGFVLENIKRIRFHEENSIPLLPVKKWRKGSRNHKPFAAVMDNKGRASIQQKQAKFFPKILTSRTLSLLAIIRSIILIAIIFGGCFLILRLNVRAKQSGRNETQLFNFTIENISEINPSPCDCQRWCKENGRLN